MKCFDVRLVRLAMVIVALESAAAETGIPLVDIKSVDPTIVIELRYGGSNNLTGHELYPLGTPALVRPEVAWRLATAQAFLKRSSID